MKKFLILSALAGGLLTLAPVDAEAARCRLGSIYRPSLHTCVSKASHAGRPYAHKARFARKKVRKHTHVARAYIGKPAQRMRFIDPPPPKATEVAQRGREPEAQDGITVALSPYGALIHFVPEMPR